MHPAIALLLTALLLVILDIVWFSWSLDAVYKPAFLAAQGSPLDLRVAGGALAWVLLALGVRYFAVSGAKTRADALCRGVVLGLIVYGVYNATNYATLRGWTVRLGLVDTAWGALACGVVSAVTFGI